MTTTNAPIQPNNRATGPHSGQSSTLPPIRQVSATRQWAVLTTAEVKLLGRNSVQVFYALIFPLMMPFLILNLDSDGTLPADLHDMFGSITLTASIIIGCTLAAYYTPVSALVNRREEAVLQRMRAGEAREGTILAAIMTPGSVLASLTSIMIFVIVKGLVGLHIGPHIWISLVGMLVTIVVCLGFAMVTANFTRTAESAQITTVPFIMIAIMGSMAIFIPKEFSQILYYIVNILPTAPAAILLNQGTLASPDWGEVAKALGFGAGWIVASIGFGWSRLRWAKRA